MSLRHSESARDPATSQGKSGLPTEAAADCACCSTSSLFALASVPEAHPMPLEAQSMKSSEEGLPLAPLASSASTSTLSELANAEELALDATVRRLSYSSSTSYTLEDDIRSIGDQMKRVLAFCETQTQSPIRLQAKVNDLEEQLQQAIAEKNYWMKRCKELAGHQPLAPAPESPSRDLRTLDCLLSCLDRHSRFFVSLDAMQSVSSSVGGSAPIRSSS